MSTVPTTATVEESASAPGAAEPAPPTEAPYTESERQAVLWISNVSHAVNHFQNQMVAVLYPVIMTELGFGYAQLGILTAIRSMFGSATQALFGFLVPFARRSRLLGVANIILGLGTLLTGVVGNYTGFVVARTVASLGASAQHPVGSSLLAGYFPTRRGTILALNTSIAGVGSLLAPLIAGLMLVVMDWRQIFLVVAVLSVIMGAAYFFFNDRQHAAAGTSRRARLAQGKESYLRVLRNRNIMVISLVMMVGAAGRGDGVNQTYLGPHLVNNLGYSIVIVGFLLSALQVGGIGGPILFGWLSDRLSRTRVIQASLFLSAVATLWLAFQGAYLPMLFLNVVIYGAVTHSRNTLTQALIADSLPDEDRDAAFSLYYFIGFVSGPIWALLTGFIMEAWGFSVAFSVLAVSYLAGMALLTFIIDPRNQSPARA